MLKISQGFLQVIFQVLPIAFHQRLRKSVFNTPLASVLRSCGRRAFRSTSFFPCQLLSQNLSGKLNQVFRCTLATIQHHVLNHLKLFCRNICVSNFGRGVYDTEVHTHLNGVIQEYGVHSLADIVVSSERETKVAHTSAHVCSRQIVVNPFCSADKVECISIVLLHTCGNSQHIGVKNYVEWVHSHLFCQYLIRTLSYLYASLVGCGLSFFVKAHHHYSSSVTLHILSMLNKLLFALFQRDRVYDALSLNALQSGLNHLPVR